MRKKQIHPYKVRGKGIFLKGLFIFFIFCMWFGHFHGLAHSQNVEKNMHLYMKNMYTAYHSPEVRAENMVFRNIRVSGRQGSYVVEGELSPAYTSFGYSVDEGHDYLIREKLKLKNNNNWKYFKLNINIPPEKFPVSGVLMLNLYVEPLVQSHLVPVPLEHF